MCTDFFHQWWGNLPESFFKWGIISDFDHMFSWMSTAEFTGLSGENVMVLSHKRPGGIPIHSDLTTQTVFPAFALQSALASGGLGAHLTPLTDQSTLVALAPVWPQLLLPLGSSSSESWDLLYYFSLQQQHSCCHCTSQCKHSVSSDHGVMTHLQHIGPESSHLTFAPV